MGGFCPQCRLPERAGVRHCFCALGCIDNQLHLLVQDCILDVWPTLKDLVDAFAVQTLFRQKTLGAPGGDKD